jgi:hypothetical protein
MPDRKVWGEAWGTLPERGFAVPAPEEIPPQSLAAVQSPNGVSQQLAPILRQQLQNNTLRRNQR